MARVSIMAVTVSDEDVIMKGDAVKSGFKHL